MADDQSKVFGPRKEEPKSFSDRMKGFVDTFDKGLGVAENAMLFGYGPEVVGGITALTGGDYKKAVEQERARNKQFEKDYPIPSFGLELGGGLAGMLAGGELLAPLKGAPGVARVTQVAKPVVQTAKKIAPAAAVAGGIAGARHGEQATGDTSITGRAEGATEGMVEAFLAARHLPEAFVASLLGAVQGSGEAGPDKRAEGALAGGLTGGAAGVLLPVAGKVLKPVATRIVDPVNAAVRKAFGLAESEPISTPLKNAARRLGLVGEEGRPLPTREEVDRINAERAARGQKPLTGMEIANQEQLLLTRSAGRRKAPERAKALREHVQESLPGETRTMAAPIGPVGPHGPVAPPPSTEGPVPELLRKAGHTVGSTEQRASGIKLRENPHHVLSEQFPSSGKTVEAHVESLEGTRSQLAEEQYGPAYEQKLKVSPELADLLEDPVGKNRKSIQRAVDVTGEAAAYGEKTGRAGDKQVVDDVNALKKYYEELDKFEDQWGKAKVTGLTPDQEKMINGLGANAKMQVLKQLGYDIPKELVPPKLPEISAKTLDRIRINLRNVAEGKKGTILAPSDEQAVGSALSGIVAKIDSYLDGVPGLTEARKTYKDLSERAAAASDFDKMFKSTPAEFVGWVSKNMNAIGDMRVAFNEWLSGKTNSASEAKKFYEEVFANKNGIREKLTSFLGPQAQDVIQAAERQNVMSTGMNHVLYDSPTEFNRWVQGLSPAARKDAEQLVADHLTGHTGAERDVKRLVENLHGDVDLREKVASLVGQGKATVLFDAAQRVDVMRAGEEFIGKNPVEFDRWFDRLSEQAKNDLKYVLQRAISPTGGFKTDVATNAARILTRLTRDPNIKANVEKMFADEPGMFEQILQHATSLRDKASRSVLLSGTGSGTSVDLEGAQMINNIGHMLHYKKAALQFLQDWVNEGNRVTPQEADALFDFMEGDAHALLDAIEKNPKGFLGTMVRVTMGKTAGGRVASMLTTPPPPPPAPAAPEGDPFAAPTGESTAIYMASHPETRAILGGVPVTDAEADPFAVPSKAPNQ